MGKYLWCRSLNSGLVRLRDSQTLILSGIIQDSDRRYPRFPSWRYSYTGYCLEVPGESAPRGDRVANASGIDDAVDSSFGYNYKPEEARQMLSASGGVRVPQ